MTDELERDITAEQERLAREERGRQVRMHPEEARQLLRALAELEAKGGVSFAHGGLYYHRGGVLSADIPEPKYKLTLFLNTTEALTELADAFYPKLRDAPQGGADDQAH